MKNSGILAALLGMVTLAGCAFASAEGLSGAKVEPRALSNEQQYSEGIRYALEQLRSETKDGFPFLEGYTVGYPGRQGTFVLLWPFFFARGSSRHDVAQMLNDKSPLVRILGARRVLEGYLRPLPIDGHDVSIVKKLAAGSVPPALRSPELVRTQAEVPLCDAGAISV